MRSFFAVSYTTNQVGDLGTVQLAEMLQLNTMLACLALDCMFEVRETEEKARVEATILPFVNMSIVQSIKWELLG
jgi:hypothetical protein